MAIGELSAYNNSTTAISAGGAFTGEWEDVQRFDSLTVAVATDQDGYCEIQFSPDGTNVDSTLTRYYRTALINPPHRFTIARKWFRIRFFNTGSGGQTYFRLQCLLGDKQPLNVPLAGTVSNDYDSVIVRPTDYHHAVARGLWQGRENWVKFGYNPDIDTGTDPEVIWANGAAFGPSTILLTPDTWTFTSSSVEDHGASPTGTGAQSLIVYYNDANGLPATGTVTLNGTGSVETSFSGYGINRVAVLTSGTAYTNVGTIVATNTTSGNQAAVIPAGSGVTQQCIFYTPHGYNALINDVYVNALKIGVGSQPILQFRGYAFNVATTQTRYELFRLNMDTAVDNSFELTKRQPFVLNSSDVFWLEAETDVDNASASARFALTSVRLNTT